MQNISRIRRTRWCLLKCNWWCAQYYAECIKEVKDVDFLQFGIPEAMWHLRIDGFKAVVTMDSHGNSLHADVDKTSLEKLASFKEPVFK